ncbi:MAG: site-specific integrase [Roseiarcus sp.]
MRVDEIKRWHVREFRDMLLDFPRAIPTAIAKKPLKDILAWAARRKEDLETAIAKESDREKRTKLEDEASQLFLSRVTVNAKGIGSIAALMAIAIPDYDLSGDPCAGLLLPIEKGDVLERRPFTPAHLQAMRASPVFQNQPKLTKGSSGAAAYWLPLIALYSGVRMEEIGQLSLTDIRDEDGIPYFWIRDDEDEDEEAFDSGSKRRRRRGRDDRDEGPKSLKTEASRRRVPIHHVLMELGLLDYVAARRAAGDAMLFPLLKPYNGRWTKNFSRYWARYQDKYITKDAARVFHSFRHGFITVLRNKPVPKEHIKALVGYSRDLEEELKNSKDTTDLCGDSHLIRVLNETLQQVEYPGTVFERIDQFVR